MLPCSHEFKNQTSFLLKVFFFFFFVKIFACSFALLIIKHMVVTIFTPTFRSELYTRKRTDTHKHTY